MAGYRARITNVARQFIRVRRICSDIDDFKVHAKKMKKHFLSRGYDEKHLDRTIENVKIMERVDLLRDRDLQKKDPHTVLVCTWHPKLRRAPSILHQNYNILNADIKLNKIFEEKSIIAFRRRKNLANHLCRNDVRKKILPQSEKCNGCKICHLISTNDTIVNKNNGAKIKIKPGASCKTTGIIYAVNCKKCDKIYVGHSGDSMSIRWSKHKYDIVNRPSQNELATHCHKNHDLEKDIELYVLDHGICLHAERERLEDRYICKLQAHQSNGGGLNNDVHFYAKEMYQVWAKALNIKPIPNPGDAN